MLRGLGGPRSPSLSPFASANWVGIPGAELKPVQQLPVESPAASLLHILGRLILMRGTLSSHSWCVSGSAVVHRLYHHSGIEGGPPDERSSIHVTMEHLAFIRSPAVTLPARVASCWALRHRPISVFSCSLPPSTLLGCSRKVTEVPFRTAARLSHWRLVSPLLPDASSSPLGLILFLRKGWPEWMDAQAVHPSG